MYKIYIAFVLHLSPSNSGLRNDDAASFSSLHVSDDLRKFLWIALLVLFQLLNGDEDGVIDQLEKRVKHMDDSDWHVVLIQDIDINKMF